ncbi:hypothetical protein H5410_021307 [Solanum commersonii]|uniref:Uncharacterized protein n=1 Tax=Solanum commersonii TaxID=4109 RepID=A0A9J5ZBK9_SOLCO|nr:hypothetical protein H5410_021307 [Solanum commersonii]
MPTTNPWPLSKSNVVGQLRLRDIEETLSLGKKSLFLLSQNMERFRKRSLAWCYTMVNLEFGHATLRAELREIVRVKNPHYPMAEKSEEETQDLHLTWCYETFQVMFEV